MPLIVLNALFDLGEIIVTARVRERVPEAAVLHALTRHVHGDWGYLDEEAWRHNDAALEHGFGVCSVYYEGDVVFFVGTEPECSRTIVLLPDDVPGWTEAH